MKSIVAALILSLGLVAAARAQDADFGKRCEVIQAYVTKQLRAGRNDLAKPFMPSIEACLTYSKARLDAEARKIIDDYNAMQAARAK